MEPTTGRYRLLLFILLILAVSKPSSAEVIIVPNDLGTAGGTASYGHDLNEAGMVVGKSGTRVQEAHAFLWRDAEGMIDLGTLGGNESRAVDSVIAVKFDLKRQS